MPRYFLNIRDHDALIVDPDGDDLPNLDDVRIMALEIIQDIMGRPETYGNSRLWSARCFEITDESGTILMSIPFPGV